MKQIAAKESGIADSPAVAKAMKDFVGTIGKKEGFDSIQISSAGKTVTIDKAGAERIRKNADAVVANSKRRKSA